MTTTGKPYLLVGGYPTDVEAHGVTRKLTATLEQEQTPHSLVALEPPEGFVLHCKGEGDEDEDEEKKSHISAALYQTDFNPAISAIADAAERARIGIGYCTGGTLLAHYQQGAHAHDDLTAFDGIILLDAPTGLTTEQDTFRIGDYAITDAVGFYDDQIPDTYTPNIPQLKVAGTNHLWEDVPRSIGDAIYDVARNLEDLEDGNMNALLIETAARYDGLEYRVSRHEPECADTQLYDTVRELLPTPHLSNTPGYDPV